MTFATSIFGRTLGSLRRVSAIAACLRGVDLLSAACFALGDGESHRASGLSVDTSNRRDVLVFYHSVYGNGGQPEASPDWDGNVSALLPGKTSAAFQAEVLRRVNFYRALAGVPANLAINADKSAKAQQAALLCARNRGLSHHPAKEHPGWVGLDQLPSGVEASANSNLSLGACGPAAVDGQMRDDGDANHNVGHRRWLLSPRLGEVGIGDVPDSPGFPAANAIWVVGAPEGKSVERFVMWPNRGYTPEGLVPARWSVSHPAADFTGATVRLRRGGDPVPVGIVCAGGGTADRSQTDPTLVWEPQIPPLSGRVDTTYEVEITGIRICGVPRDLAYEVVAFDPDVLEETPAIQGESQVSEAGGSYTFNEIAQADAYVLTVARGSAVAWMEGAEGSDRQVLTDTAPGYAVVQSRVVHSGTGAFHLTHPGSTAAGFSDQTFQLPRRVVPGPGSVLQFSETGRFAETTTTLNAELSVDEGRTWTTVWNRTGVGLSSALFDKGWTPHAVTLGPYHGTAVLVRFSLKRNGGPVAVGTTEDHGFFVDNIVLTHSTELADPVRTHLGPATTQFRLDAATAGRALIPGECYYLSLAPRIGGRLFPPGALKVVKVSASPPVRPSEGEGGAVSAPNPR